MTWGIPKDFGGLTSVLLRRSAMIAKLGSVTVPLLTFDPTLDVKAKTRELAQSGKLGEGVLLRNCWQELATMSDRELRAFAAISGAPIANASRGGGEGALAFGVADVSRKRRTRVDDAGVVRCVEHLRADGSVFVRDVREGRSERRLVVLDHKERMICQWGRARDLYFAWMDHVVGGHETVIVNDSKYVGSFLHHYRRRNVRTVQVFHNPHLVRGAASPYGPFTKSRSDIIFDHEGFDGLAFLTERQRDEFLAAFSRLGHTFVVPNSREIAERLPDPTVPRRPGAGIMLARLSGQKQVDHAVRAMGMLEGRYPGTDAGIDVYGSGPLEAEISSLIASEGISDRVRLKGYDPSASSRLAQASFLVLSSRFEGLPLVLVEAMAAGCIPIAYDVRYGPSDVITHGVDGFVVPADDFEALAAAIRTFVMLDESERAAMRAAAQRKARQFDDLKVTRMWSDACTELIGGQPRPAKVGSGAVATLAEFRGSDGGEYLLIRGELLGEWTTRPEEVRIVAFTRNRRYGFDYAVETEIEDGRTLFEAGIPADRLNAKGHATYDFWLTTRGRSRRRRLVAGGTAVSEDGLCVPGGSVRVYPTAHGNLSLELN